LSSYSHPPRHEHQRRHASSAWRRSARSGRRPRRIEAAGSRWRADVTRQYLAALRARDGVALARRELETAEEALAGGGADGGRRRHRLDAAQAEVEKGRAEVDLLQAQPPSRRRSCGCSSASASTWSTTSS
jgi:hypothetical protein